MSWYAKSKTVKQIILWQWQAAAVGIDPIKFSVHMFGKTIFS